MSATSSKPKVSLILREDVMGGVRSLIHGVTQSRLAEKFEFAVVPPGEAWRQLCSGPPRVFLFEDACAWRRVPELAAFRLRKGRSRIAIQENHYSEHFVRCRVPSPARFHTMLRLSYKIADRVVAISQGQVSVFANLASRLHRTEGIERWSVWIEPQIGRAHV